MMLEATPKFEAIGMGPGAIQSVIQSTAEELNKLLGDKVSGTKYDTSYNQISNKLDAKQVLNAIASNVKSWSQSIRANTSLDTQWKVVYLVASVIPALAAKLYQMSQDARLHNDKDVQKVFYHLARTHYGANGRNRYEYLADMAYAAWISALEIGVKSRRQTEVENDYNASRQLHDLLFATYLKFKDILALVRDIVNTAGVGDQVSPEEINSAARWVFLFDCIKNDLYGAEQKGKDWYSNLDSIAQFIYKYTANTLSNTKNVNADNKTKKRDMALDVNTNVVKDMSTIGDNTEQMNILNNDTSFTCECYFKIYTQTGMSSCKYTEAAGYYAYKIMYHMFRSVGITIPASVVPNNEANAAKFSELVKRTFMSRAMKSTADALSLRADLISALNLYEDSIPTDKDEFNDWHVRLYGKSAATNTREKIADAIDKIRTNILYVGDASISGQTPGGEQIAASKLATPVVTFGDSDTSDRNKQEDLNEAGKITKGCFEFSDDSLKIFYDGNRMEEINSESDEKYTHQAASESDTQYVIDVIPRDQIRQIAGNYVSSKLLPAIVSRSRAWIMMYGIKAFAKIQMGDLADSVDISATNNAANQIISASNIMQDSRISASERSAMTFESDAFIDGLVTSKLMNSVDANNSERRMEFIRKIKPMVTPELMDSFTKIHAVCDSYTRAVTIYAEMQDKPMKTARESVYSVTPSLDALISGKQFAVDNIVLSVAYSKYPNELKTSYDVNDAIHKMLHARGIVQKCKDQYSTNMRGCLVGLFKYISTVDNVMSLASQLEIYDLLLACIPSTYDSWHDSIVSLYDKMMSAKNPVQFANDNSSTILAVLDKAMAVDPAAIEKIQSVANENIAAAFNPDADGSIKDPSINALHNYLTNLATNIERRGITVKTLAQVKIAIAKSMDGVPMNNLNKINQLKINQLVLPVKVFITAADIANPEDPKSNERLERDFEELKDAHKFALDDGGDEPMDEVTPFHPSNLGNAFLKTSRRNDENAINSDTLYNDMPFNDDYLEKILSAAEQYEESDQVVDATKQTIQEVVDEVRELGVETPNVTVDSDDPIEKISQEYKRNLAYINILSDVENMDPSFTAYYMKCANQLSVAQKTYYKCATQLDNISKHYPSFGGIVHALLSARITASDLRKSMKYLDIAATQRDSLVKYRSYSAANVEDAGLLRQFAYTASDESTIAQIMCVLGSFIAAPHVDSLDDLIDSLAQVNRMINKYSKNKLSVKVSSQVLKTLSKVSANKPTDNQNNQLNDYEAEVSATIVELINQLGGLILSRNHDELDTDLIERTNKIERPNVNDADYGSATDSFARAQLRTVPKGYTKHNLKNLDKEEIAARQEYIPAVKQDLKNNPELAKFAYALGNAFNAYERALTDERVSNVNERSLSSIESSLSGLGLFKNLSTSDLQRELVSAIIDDERNHDKTYPRVKEVVRSAQAGVSFPSYAQMYSAKVGSKDNILHDQKTEDVAFDENGNRTTDDAAMLTNEDITRLATKVINPTNDTTRTAEAKRVSELTPFQSIPDLVHSIRMCVFEQLYRVYGTLDATGKITYTEDYEIQANRLMDAAMRQLYHLCDDMDTPIADIILVSTSLGRKLARLVVMDHVSDQLNGDSDIDLDYAGMVSNEPNAYPQMMSDEESEVDAEWITKITEILSFIPDSMSRSEVLRSVEMYNMNEVTRQQLARDEDGREFLRIVDKLLRVDTETGIPAGFWGDDSSQRKEHIAAIFNQLCTYKKDVSIPWDECAAQLRADFMDALSRGGNLLSIGGVSTSDAAKRRIGHLRLNPFYATNVKNNTVTYKDMLTCLASEGIISSYGRIVKTKYPALTFDKHTFDYIVNLALDLNSKYKLSVGERNNSSSKEAVLVNSFLTTLMLVTNEFRVGAYLKMRDDAVDFKQEHNDLAVNAFEVITDSQNIYTELYDELIHISLGKWDKAKNWITDDVGWLTKEAYAVLCYYAASKVYQANSKTSEDTQVDSVPLNTRIEQAFIDAFNQLAAGGNVTDDVKGIDRAPHAVNLQVEPVPNENPAPAENPVLGENPEPTPAENSVHVSTKETSEQKPSASGRKPRKLRNNGTGQKSEQTPSVSGRKPRKLRNNGTGKTSEQNVPASETEPADEFIMPQVYSNAPELQGRHRPSVESEPENDAYDFDGLREMVMQNSDLFENPDELPKPKPKSKLKRAKTSDFDQDNIISDDDE